MKTVIATILLLLFLLSGIASSAQVVSNFSIDSEGWTVFDNNAGTSTAATHNAAGGNPGGYASFTTSSPALNMYWTAPAKFLGNQSFSYNQTLSFDLDVSTAGADNSIGDVRLVGSSGVILFYQLPAKPVANSWPSATNSYSVQLNEASWHFNTPTGAIATINQMKSVLVNITSFQIRAKYLSGNTGPYTVKLDNVVLNKMPVQTAPVITSFSPLSALAGTTITITGSNFNTTASQNLIYFQGVKTIATSATATQLTVKVPVSAHYGQITVENLGTGLQGTSTQSFSLLFDNNKDFGGQIIPASLTRGYSTLLQNGTETPSSNNQNGNMDTGDLDGDGWVDLIATETGVTSPPKIYLFRNLGTGGTVSVSSFAAPISLSLSTIPGGNPQLGELTVTDVDSDGLLDIAAVSSSGNTQGYLAVFRNTSTSGSISFSGPEFFGYPYYSSQLTSTSGDFDGDGRIDFAYTTGTSPGGIWINQNLSTPGNVDFSYGFSVGTNLSHRDLVVGDLNADGKSELIASLGNGFEIYQNNSSIGTIGFVAPFTLTRTNVTTIHVADLDADNKLDLIWGDLNIQYVYFSRNIYSGSVLNATSFDVAFQVANSTGSIEGITVSDINADGHPDVVLTGSYDLAILQNRGNGSPLSISSFPNSTIFQSSVDGQFIKSTAPVVADLDGDNKPEVMHSYTNVNVTAPDKGIYIFHNESFPAPAVSSISPSSGNSGSTVTLTGDFMFTKNTTPSARLDKINSTVTGSPSNTSTSVINPTGSISGRIAITNHGLTGFSPLFNSTFATDRVINASSFGPGIDFGLTGTARDAIDVADFDDNGQMDVMTVDNFSTGKIFKNTHATAGTTITSSSLTLEATTFSGGYNLIAFDIDGDGKTDLNSGANLFQNTSGGSISFGTGVSTSASSFNYAAAADFNKDGKTDLAVTNGSANIQIYPNESSKGTYAINGKFAPFNSTAINLAKPNNYGGVVAADFDGDGYDDLASTSSIVGVFTYYRNLKQYGPITTSSFSAGIDVVTGTQPYSLTANDFDNDGKIDVAVTHYNATFVSVYLNTSTIGTISFAAPVNLTCLNKGYNIASQDLDGDGKAEIIVIHQPNPGPGSFSVFQNKSTSGVVSFPTVINYALSRNPQNLSITDINSDQKPDILIVASGGSTAPTSAIMVFENKISIPPVITNKIFYDRADGTIWATSGDGSPDQFITNGFRPKLSPDGRYLLLHSGPFTGSQGGVYGLNIYTFDLATNTRKLIANNSDISVGYSWFADGERIASDFSCSMYTLNRDGSGVTLLQSGNCFDDTPTIRLSDGKIVFQNQPQGLLLINSDGSGRQAIPNTVPGDMWPSWSPDGQWITFSRFNSGYTAFIAQYKIKPDGSNLTLLTNLMSGESMGASDSGGAWTTDGQSIIISGYIDCTWGLYEIPADGSKILKRLATTFSVSNPISVGSIVGTPPLAYLPLYPNTPTIASFSPTTGAEGITTVTITGSNFSTTPANNIVKFNGTTAVVTASTATTITTTVPVGATTGPITISSGCTPVTSTGIFTIAPPSTITITQQPSDFIACMGSVATFTVAATGTTNITYQWQFSSTGAVGSFNDITNGGGYTNTNTATLSVNTTGNFGAGRYRCKINGDLAPTAFTNDKGLFINPVPTAPTTTPDSDCVPASLTLTASGGTNGQYRWYNVASGGTAIAGQTNSTYITPLINTTVTYYVSIQISSCESSRTPVIATIAPIAKPVILFDPPFITGSSINLCEGDLQKFSAPPGFASYTWSNGETTEEIKLTTSGVYSVIVEDGAGCVSPPSDAIPVVINPYPNATITANGNELIASLGDSYQWYQNGDKISGATNQSFELSVLEYGEYLVDVTDNGCTSTSDKFTYLITRTELAHHNLKIYPNPFSDKLFVDFFDQGEIDIHLLDAMGRTLKTFSGQSKTTIILDNLPSGTYTLCIQQNTKRFYHRIVKE